MWCTTQLIARVKRFVRPDYRTATATATIGKQINCVGTYHNKQNVNVVLWDYWKELENLSSLGDI